MTPPPPRRTTPSSSHRRARVGTPPPTPGRECPVLFCPLLSSADMPRAVLTYPFPKVVMRLLARLPHPLPTSHLSPWRVIEPLPTRPAHLMRFIGTSSTKRAKGAPCMRNFTRNSWRRCVPFYLICHFTCQSHHSTGRGLIRLHEHRRCLVDSRSRRQRVREPVHLPRLTQ